LLLTGSDEILVYDARRCAEVRREISRQLVRDSEEKQREKREASVAFLYPVLAWKRG
jgi:hypothetical protein